MTTPQLTISTTTKHLGSPKSGWKAAFILPLFLCVTSGIGSAQEMKAEKIYGWSFRHSDDRNSDLWPDEWQRRQDRAHPAYIEMRIVPHDPSRARKVSEAKNTLTKLIHAWETKSWDPSYVPEATPPTLATILDHTVLDNCVEIRMDGGAAEMISPIFPMDARFSYRLQSDIWTSELAGHEAWAELQLLNKAGEVIGVISTDRVSGTKDWKRFSAISNEALQGELWAARIHLKVEPRRSLRVTGIAKFDNLSVARMPRLDLSTRLAFNVAAPGQPIEIDCNARGIRSGIREVQFELRDVSGNLQKSEKVPLRQKNDAQNRQFFANAGKKLPHYVVKSNMGAAFDGRATWHVTPDGPGLYYVNVNLGYGGTKKQRRGLLLAVIQEEGPISAGPFGWTINRFGPELHPLEVPEMATRFGAGWVKYPVWFDMYDIDHAETLIKLTDQLQDHGIRCIGLLDEPPESQQAAFVSAGEQLHAVTVFRDPDAWEPLLEPVLTRMGMKMTWFQLGSPKDMSFMGTAGVVELVQSVRSRMQAYCQELQLIMNWDWLEYSAPDDVTTPWNAVHYRTDHQLTKSELEAYGSALAGSNREMWVTLDPLPASKYSPLERVRDLTERMIVVRRNAIRAAFITDPFDPESGLLTPGKKAGEMLIPWHQLVSHLGTAVHIGSIRMPGKSVNHIFSRGEEGIMVLWNDSGVDEELFLGYDVTATDIWGRPVAIENTKSPRGTPVQRFHVDSWPILIRGVNINVVRWRQNFQINVTNIASSLQSGQSIPIQYRSPFDQSVTGRVTLNSDSLLAHGRSSIRMEIPPSREQVRQVPVEIKGDASAGDHDLRFDFELDADRMYQFSVFRKVTLGLGDIQILWEPTRNDDSSINLRVEVLNNTRETLNFDCKLFPPGHPYQRFQILQAAPGSTLREFNLTVPLNEKPRSHWIRCEGIGTGRVLNYRVEF